jgi:predicted metallopeptidase
MGISCIGNVNDEILNLILHDFVHIPRMASVGSLPSMHGKQREENDRTE